MHIFGTKWSLFLELNSSRTVPYVSSFRTSKTCLCCLQIYIIVLVLLSFSVSWDSLWSGFKMLSFCLYHTRWIIFFQSKKSKLSTGDWCNKDICWCCNERETDLNCKKINFNRNKRSQVLWIVVSDVGMFRESCPGIMKVIKKKKQTGNRPDCYLQIKMDNFPMLYSL